MRKYFLPAMGLLCMIWSLPLFAQNTDVKKAAELVKKHAAQLHLSPEDADDAVINNAYTDASTQIEYVYLQQAHKGIKVFNGIMTIIFRNGEVLYASGKFVYDMPSKVKATTPSISAAAAVEGAASHLKLAPSGIRIVQDKMAAEKKIVFSPAGIARKNIEAELVWVASGDKKSVRLAWNVNIDVLGSSDWWNVRVDAMDGKVLEKDNWTVQEDAVSNPRERKAGTRPAPVNDAPYFTPAPPSVTTAGYYVVPFPFESPKHHAMAIENQPWLKAGAGNAATTNGWHFDGTNNYNITRGNNVFAYLDVQNNNTPNALSNWPDTSSTTIPSLTFGNIADFNQSSSLALNKKGAITNLFYWNNIIHDVTYQYGFNEVSGNFQTDNMGRGGNGNDYVQAEAQDASGTNNANFSTPADGARPRMQMFLWTGDPVVKVNSPASIAGNYAAVEGNYSTANKLTSPITAQLVLYQDAGGTNEACNGAPSNSIAGKIALIARGNCNFTVKVKAAQDAGALAVIMINNVPGNPIIMGGADNSITIPSVMISDLDGVNLLSQVGNNENVTLVPPIQPDGDFDNGVVSHEYTHGISNRLTGGPASSSCLSNAEQGGEGWSDFVALMMTTNWATAQLTDGAGKRPMGNYVIGAPLTAGGIRTYPYSTNMTTNPLTYNALAGNPESHFIGEVWCSALWDMTWNIIQQAGSIEPNLYNANGTGGNVIAMKLVMEGMRLQPCQPGFLDARDAILAADSILYNSAHKCSIWRAFARRGMGFSAVQGLSTSATDQVAAFDVPTSVSLSKSATPVIMTNGSQQTINLAATCQCQPASNYTIRDTIPAGFSYISSTGGGTLSGNIVSFSSVNFTAEQQVKNFSVTLQANSSGCVIDTAINDDRTSTIGGMTAAVITGASQWVTSSVRSKSPASAWLATNSTTTTDFTLTSNSFTAAPLSVLSFWQYFTTENQYDGGRVELSNDGGITWINAGPYMVQNGYNTKMDASSPWVSGTAFSGVSYGQGSNQFINTVLNLSPFNGQSLKIRFRMRTDAGNPGIYEGWFIDDILQLNGCGGMVKAGLYNASNVKVDSAAFPLFVKLSGTAVSIQSQPAALTVCVGANASFNVAATGGTLSYQWQLSTNNGASYSNIAGATSSTLTVANATASMNGYLYRCLIDNGSNTATSSPAMLSISAGTSAGTVSNAAVCASANATFSSNATGGTLSYQWQVSTDGGTTYTNIAGATASNLSVNNVTAAQNNAKYRVVVTGACGVATSTAGTLTVNTAPVVTVGSIPANVCSSDAPYTLTASIPGGVWTGQGMSGDKFSPSGLAAGTYAVTYSVTNASGCTGSATASILVNDCVDKHIALDAPGAILIYPNPNSGKFWIRFNTDLYTSLSMKIFASDGKLVSEQMINGISYGMELPMNLRKLASDIYQLSLYDSKTGKEKTFKVMIAR